MGTRVARSVSRRLRGLAACLACCALLPPLPAPGAGLVDDRGRPVEASPAHRIVVLAPNLTELAFAAGAGGRIVAVSAYSDYPPQARVLPRVGDALRLDAERILLLKPDLVLAWKSGNRTVDLELLDRLGLRVFALELARLDDVPRALRTIGALADSADEAERAAATFESEAARLGARYGARPPVTVFYQIWHEPPVTVNGEHMISDAIRLCGGRNVFAALPTLTPTVSLEAVLAADPQAVVVSVSDPAEAAQATRELRRFASLPAVKRGRVFAIHPDLIQRQTPRILEGVRQLCEALESVRTQ